MKDLVRIQSAKNGVVGGRVCFSFVGLLGILSELVGLVVFVGFK